MGGASNTHRKNDKGSCPCARYEGIWESGGLAPFILKVGTYIRLEVRFMLRPF
jgi:hypothetical protein